MPLYVWDKHNFSNLLDNDYGESMICVVAENAKRAIEVLKEYTITNLKLWHQIQGTNRLDREMGTWSFPTHPMYKYYQEYNKLKTKFKPAYQPYKSKQMYELIWEEYQREWHNWILNNYIDIETGYGKYAVLPKEYQTDKELFLCSRAS